MKSKNIIFVHGIFGWGSNELGGAPYWGYALNQFTNPFKVHEASCGPVSSFHDRACEVFAQIRGSKVDYGELHSKEQVHARYSDDYTGQSFAPDWSEDNPIILIAHSAGAHTCLKLQKLLEEDYWGCGSNAKWIEAVVCISGVLNGSTLPYMLGCDKTTGLLTEPLGNFIGNAIQIFAMASGHTGEQIYDFDLDQWIGAYKGNLHGLITALERSQFAKGKDNLAFDLTLQGCLEANKAFTACKDTYYFSIVTEQTTQGWFTPKHFPDLLMNPALAATASYQGFIVDFDNPPIPGWGNGDLNIDKWRENDGTVSSISQRYPFTGGSHLVGGVGISNPAIIKKGRWYYEKAEKLTGRSFDHLDVVFGCFSDLSIIKAHKQLYRNLNNLLLTLPP